MGPIPYRQFFRDWKDVLSLPSIFTLYDWTRREEAGTLRQGELISLALKSPRARLALRELTSDVWTFREVFGQKVYCRASATAGPDCKSVVDLGANIGLASLYFLACFEDARIGAVEPDASNFAVLRNNLAPFLNTGQCAIVRGAAWSEDVGQLWVDTDGEQNAKTVGSSQGGDPVAGYSLPTLFDRFGFETVDLLKIDIEGAETTIFANADVWLGRVRCLAIEFHDDSRRASGFDGHIRRHGFHVVEEDAHTVVAAKTAPAGRPATN
jgi:FkbM family methyltransferase